jgi:tetratricopeptide (TPR) repeat protein
MDERMAMEIATGNKVGIASTQISLAELFLGDGELENAMELARESVRSLEETKVKIDLAMAYRILGMCQRDAGDFNASTESFDIAKMMFREMDAKRDLARVLYEEALLLKKMGREEEFVETMNRSGAFFESMGMKWWTEKCRKTLEELTPPQ